MIVKQNLQNIDVLFSSGNQYKIPIYQRHYVWNTNNWEKLWTDITDIPRNGLFTGIIVTREDEDTVGKYDVIDGQQRLTTYQIILCAIRDTCNLNFPHYTGPLNSEEYIILVPSASVDSDDRYKLLLKEGPDQEAFRTLVNRGTVGREHPIHNAYIYFKEQIESYTIRELEKFYEKTTRFINVAQIELEPAHGDVSEKIFASLNATGRMLNEFDYLRNDLFLRAGEHAPFFYGSSSYWHRFFEDGNASDLDAFLRDFLKAYLGPTCFENNTKPFDLYQDHLKKPSSLIDQEFTQLSDFAQFRSDLNNSSSSIGKRMQFYKDLSLPRLDSFILFAVKQELSSSELLEVCNILESYIIRSMLCSGDWRGCYKIINDFFNATLRGSSFSVSDLEEVLNSSNFFATDGDVKSGLKGAGYKSNQLILYILYRIETKLRPSKTDFNSFKLLRMQEGGPTPYLEESIGNLTLQEFDPPPTWPRIPFNNKKSDLQRTVAPNLYLTVKICGFHDWTATEIQKMEEYLSEQFITIWPG